ncbi:hypothetical protein [Formosa sp. 4Alg 33]|uniref:hypothetical protein n=1 Tax=Formosa sp. 4Alg 33 TaxID=3382189 RepID=UPI003D9C1F4F
MKIKFTYILIGILYTLALCWFFISYHEEGNVNLIFNKDIKDGDIIFRCTATENSEVKDFNEYGIIKKSLGDFYVWDNKSTMKRRLSKWVEKGTHHKVYRIKASESSMTFELLHGTYNHLLHSDALEFITEKNTPFLNQNSNEDVQNSTKMHDILNYIPNGYHLIYFENRPNRVHADLNKDGILDYAVLITDGNRDVGYIDANKVKLAIFEGQEDGAFTLKNETGNLTYAFIYRNLDQNIKVSDSNVISIAHQSMRHDYELKFRYQKERKEYMLVGTAYNNYGNAIHKGAENTKTNFISGKRISTINGTKTTIIEDKFISISEVNDNNIYDLIH